MPRPAVVPKAAATTPRKSFVSDWPIWRQQRHHVRGCAQTRAVSHDEVGLVLEADTVVVDMHDAVHRPAFNLAFERLGLACVKWSSRVYYDIRYRGQMPMCCAGIACCTAIPSVLSVHRLNCQPTAGVAAMGRQQRWSGHTLTQWDGQRVYPSRSVSRSPCR